MALVSSMAGSKAVRLAASHLLYTTSWGMSPQSRVPSTSSVTASCSAAWGSEASATFTIPSAKAASSRVLLNASTK